MPNPSQKPLEFDYVIVGAGPSAMGILYGLLERFEKDTDGNDTDENTTLRPLPFSVAIIERGHGPPHKDPLVKQPHRWYEAAHNVSNGSDSGSVELHPGQIMGRTLDVPVGKGLGGSSNTNACLCMPPLCSDLEKWPLPWKTSLLPAAQHIQRRLKENDALHELEKDGATSASTSNLEWCNSVSTLVTVDPTTGSFVRSNYYSGLLEPLLFKHPQHLQQSIRWFRGVQAERLLMDDGRRRITGVECRHVNSDNDIDNDTKLKSFFSIHATRRVILCAGAIESPALLLVSGLGNEPPLQHGIGKNLKDQPLLAKASLNIPLSLSGWRALLSRTNRSTSGIAALGHSKRQHDNENVFQVAIAESNCYDSILPSAAGAAFRWNCKNLLLSKFFEITFRAVTFCTGVAIRYTPLGWILHRFITVTMIFLMQPHSSGEVTIHPKRNGEAKAKSTTAATTTKENAPMRRSDVTVHVDPGYLQTESDLMAFKETWDHIMESIPKSSASVLSFEVFPKPLKWFLQLFTASSDSWFRLYCRCFLQPYYHFAGTCVMSTESSSKDNDGDDQQLQPWVLESSTLKLRGYEGLYICDASVFPGMISNPPALTCAALGYQFSSMIRQEDRLAE